MIESRRDAITKKVTMMFQVLSAIAGLLSAILWIAAAYTKVHATIEEANPENYRSVNPGVPVSTGGAGIFYKEPSGRIINLGKSLQRQGALNGYAALAASAAIIFQILHMAVVA